MFPSNQSESARPNFWQWLALLFLLAELLRIGAAVALVHRNRQQGIEHEFADTELYWKLGLNLAAGEPYDDGKRQVLRTPGYPLFLAACIELFGETTTGARHAQAAIGSVSCLLLYFLVRRLMDHKTALVAAFIAAIYPFAVFFSVVLLSESLFSFFLLVQLFVLASLLDRLDHGGSSVRMAIDAGLVGAAGACATLVRPSWSLSLIAVAALIAIGAWNAPGTPRSGSIRWRCSVAVLALVLAWTAVMAPWWVRNWRVTGRFVPMTLWVGASLVDGWNDRASGASNMEFMDRPERYGLRPDLNALSEWEQDQYLRRAAWQFARTNPGRVVQLAVVKFVRFWNPFPNASEWRSWPMRLVSFLSVGPLLCLMLVGIWKYRCDWRALALLAGPVIYFCLIHLIFVSSIRYREAAILPAWGLSAAAITRRRSPDARASISRPHDRVDRCPGDCDQPSS